MHGRSRAARCCTHRKASTASSKPRQIITPVVFPSFVLYPSPGPPFLLLCLSLRFSRWFQGAASPLSRVGWAERKRLVALTAPKREPSMKSSTYRSRSAHWRVRASTAAHVKNKSIKIFAKLNRMKQILITHEIIFLSCVWLFYSLCVFSVWEWLEVLPHQQGQEDAHRLHQERSALRHREVSQTLSFRRTGLIFESDCMRGKNVFSSFSLL